MAFDSTQPYTLVELADGRKLYYQSSTYYDIFGNQTLFPENVRLPTPYPGGDEQHHSDHVAMGTFPASYLGNVVCVGDSTCARRYGGIHLAGGRATYGATGFSIGGFGTVRCDGNGGTGTAYINCDGAGRARYKEPGASDYGAWTDISRGGCYYLPGSVADTGAIVQIAPSTLPSTDTTDDMTVSGSWDYLYDADDWVTWLRFMLGGNAYATWKNFGISGTTVAQCLASLPVNCSTLTVDTAIISVGLNSVVVGSTADTIINEIEQICDYFRGKGARIVLATLPPANSASYTSTTVRRRIADINTRIEAMGRNDMMIAPVHRALADPTSLTGAYRTNYGNSDAIHLSPQGAYAAARDTRTEMINRGWAVVAGRRPNTALDAYDATYAPYGNRFSAVGTSNAGMMLGTGGTRGTGTGTLPDLWRDNGSALTGTASIAWTAPADAGAVARTDGIAGSWFQADMAGGTGTATAVATYFSGYPTLSSGTYQATMDVQMSGVSGGNCSFSLGLGGRHRWTTPSGIYLVGLAGDTDSVSLNIKTDDIVLYASAACYADYTVTAGASATMKWRIARSKFGDLPVA